MRIIIFGALISILWPSVMWADEKLPDISNMSREDIERLPKDVMEKLPVLAVFSRGDGTLSPAIMENSISSMLGRLMYFNAPSEKEFRDAIKKFQRDIDDPQTGDLTMGQFEKLHVRSARISDTPVYLGYRTQHKIPIRRYENIVGTEGTWAVEADNEDDKLAYPINYAKIRCYKLDGTCTMFHVELSVPKLKGPDEGHHLFAHLETYKIISWSDSEVVSQSSAQCRTHLMTVNISSNEVFQIVRNTGNKGCDSLLPLGKPRIVRLMPEGPSSFGFWEDRKKETSKYLNSDFQKWLKSHAEKIEALDATAKNKMEPEKKK